MKELKKKEFTNGVVYSLKFDDGYPIEVTDTFLPFETKDCTFSTNKLKDYKVGDRTERWMIGVSTMSGCSVGCKFCATAKLKKWRPLTASEIVQQVVFVLNKNPDMVDMFLRQGPKEFKINYTRMGEPFLNIKNIKEAIRRIDNLLDLWGIEVHHYISTIGVKGADYSWVKKNVTLQLSLHSLDEERRRELIPFKKLVTIEELGKIRTKSNLKTTVNLTLVDTEDFNITELQKWFDPEFFFIKLSPINPNEVSDSNNMGEGVINQVNLI